MKAAVVGDTERPNPAQDEVGGTQEVAACWGAQLHDGAGCTPQFVPGKLHFKNNFCDNCRDCLLVPIEQVCALSAEQAACFVNRRSKGFWNHAPASMGGGQYRIINNTAGCIGPWLALFRDQPPQLQWQAISGSTLTLTLFTTHPCLSRNPRPRPLPCPLALA